MQTTLAIRAGGAFALLVAAAISCSGCGNRSPMVSPVAMPGRDLNLTGLRLLNDGDLEKAEDYFLRALEAARAVDHLDSKAEALYNVALVHREQERLDEAAAELRLAEVLFRRLHRPRGAARSVASLATIHAAKGRLEESKQEYDRALAMAPDEVAPEILTNLAVVHLRQGNIARARNLAEDAVDQAEDPIVLSDALFNLARIYLAADEREAAEEILTKVLDIDRQLGRRRQLAATLALLGRLALEGGRQRDAFDCYERAAGVFESLGLDAEAANARSRAATASGGFHEHHGAAHPSSSAVGSGPQSSGG